MKIIDISKCNDEVISYINELQNKYAELDKLNKELDKSNITIFEENNYLIKENRRLNNIINEINSIVEYWGYDKEHNDISSFRMAMKNIKDILGSDKE